MLDYQSKMKKTTKILLLEDEQRAGEKLIRILSEINSDTEITWKRSVIEGTAILRESNNFDLIFSDIELLDGNAFGIYETITPNCPIIFCTAYNKFYLQAFETNGIAYLLKPYTKEEVKKAWEKYQLLFQSDQEKTAGFPTELLSELKNQLLESTQSYKSRFTVKKANGVFLLKTSEVAYFQAQGDFVLAIDKLGKKHILNESLQKVAEAVNPKQFLQINRSEILNIEAVASYENYTKNRLAIHLVNSVEILYTSNSRTPAFRVWVEG
ncbi:MAG: two-component system response regulator LytT [Arenicella sp.]